MMKKIYTFMRSREWITVPVAVVSGVFLVATLVQAATTISTDITTGGNVYASSTVQATGAITGYGALNITGVSTHTGLGLFNGGASTTIFSSYGPAYFGATATSSFSTVGALTLVTPLTVGSGGMGISSVADGALVFGGVGGGAANLASLATSTSGSVLQLSFTTGRPTWVATSTLGLTGASLSAANTWTALQQFQGQASTTILSTYGPAYFGATATSSFATNGALTLVNALTYGGVTLSNAVTGTGNMVLSANPALTGTAVLAGANFSGIASTTQLKVGSDTVSTVSGMIFGSCTLVSISVTSTSSAYTTCTGATGVTSSYSVFLQVNNVMPAGLIVDAASSTATTGTLELRIFNADATNTPSTLTTGTPTINFWAVR